MYATRMLLFLRGIGIKDSFIYEGKWPIAGAKEPGAAIIEGASAKKERPVGNVVDRAWFLSLGLENSLFTRRRSYRKTTFQKKARGIYFYARKSNRYL